MLAVEVCADDVMAFGNMDVAVGAVGCGHGIHCVF